VGEGNEEDTDHTLYTINLSNSPRNKETTYDNIGNNVVESIDEIPKDTYDNNST